MGPKWEMLEETQMVRTTRILMLRHGPVRQAAARLDFVSEHHKRIAILDLFCPLDVLPSQVLVAAKRKQYRYVPLEEALIYYTEHGWVINIILG